MPAAIVATHPARGEQDAFSFTSTHLVAKCLLQGKEPCDYLQNDHGLFPFSYKPQKQLIFPYSFRLLSSALRYSYN